MATATLPIEELLAPISAEHPAGEDISEAPEWQTINEARRKDKLLGRQNTDWPMLQEVLSDCLAHKAKDLRLAVWLTEAEVKLHGFAGLRDSFRLLSGLITNFWDIGLYPEAEGGDLQFRAMPLVWMTGASETLPDAIREVPLTARTDGGADYSYLDYATSRRIGAEKDLVNANGDIDEDRQKRRQSALAAGGISVEMFEEAVRATRRAGIEPLAEVLDQAFIEFKTLDKLLDEKFGDEAPGTSEAREAFEDCRRLVELLVKRKRDEEPDRVTTSGGGETQTGGQSSTSGYNLDSFAMDGGGGSWSRAEELIREGKIQEGLHEMTRQAAQEYGRVRFQHRLRLAEICLATSRHRLAIAILEELAKQIDDLKLDAWESPEMLGRVWGRLYKSYKGDEPGSERAARAAFLFDRLCRIDPWQALRWDE